MRVLLAEDNADNREMLARRLERRGFTVDVAEDGALAVAAANNNRPDVVLMDVSMPVMTAHAMATARDECMAAGCDAFATKPVDFAALLQTIEAVTGRSAS
jgi:CheY-like chemotaxis protein